MRSSSGNVPTAPLVGQALALGCFFPAAPPQPASATRASAATRGRATCTVALTLRRGKSVDSSADEGACDLDLVGRAGEGRRVVECAGRVERPGDESDPGECKMSLLPEPGCGDADDREGPLAAVHRLQVGR